MFEEEGLWRRRMAIAITMILWKIRQGLDCHDNGCVPPEIPTSQTVVIVCIFISVRWKTDRGRREQQEQWALERSTRLWCHDKRLKIWSVNVFIVYVLHPLKLEDLREDNTMQIESKNFIWRIKAEHHLTRKNMLPPSTWNFLKHAFCFSCSWAQSNEGFLHNWLQQNNAPLLIYIHEPSVPLFKISISIF